MLRTARPRAQRPPAERVVIHAGRVVRGVLLQRRLPEAAADLVAALPHLHRDELARHAGCCCLLAVLPLVWQAPRMAQGAASVLLLLLGLLRLGLGAGVVAGAPAGSTARVRAAVICWRLQGLCWLGCDCS